MGGSKYSPLDQIGPDNVQDLRIAWRWRSVDHELQDEDPELQFNPTLQATPLMIGGRLLMGTNLGQAAAIDPATGETVWVYRALEDGAGRPRGGSTRGVSFWDDPQRNDERVFIVSGQQLVALDAQTGNPLREFGAGGMVDLAAGVPHLEEYRWTAVPLICRDTVIIGIFVIDQFEKREQSPGYIRGYDAVTGRLKWTFNTIPRPGEFGHETWEDGSWEHTGAANMWTVGSADEELGYAYIPTATATHNWYGGHRPGDNLFAESLLCLDCETGERIWHFQAIHHGVWDYDFGSTPILADITVDGRPIRAVAIVSKQAFTYVFDRVTGEPVWPIEERPVPQSDVPGEKLSPTQPFPTKPAPFDLQGITEDDLIDFTPELRAEALEIFRQYRSGPIFTPPSVRDESPGGTLGTLQVPSWVGGANWNGAAYDPETQMLYVPSITTTTMIWLREADPGRVAVPLPAGLAQRVHRRPARPAAGQAAVGAHHRHRPQYRRARLDAAQWSRPARPHRAAGPGAAVAGRAGARGAAADEDAAFPRRRLAVDAGAPATCRRPDVPRLRQGGPGASCGRPSWKLGHRRRR